MNNEFTDKQLVAPSATDPTDAYWEELLTEAGMPAELPYNSAPTPNLDVATPNLSGHGDYASLQERLDATLEALFKRERSIASTPHGLTDSKPKILDDVGEASQLTSGNLQKVQVTALRKPYAKEVKPLDSYRSDAPEQDTAQPRQRATNKTSPFKELPVVAVIDPEDDRPYATRLEEVTRQDTEKWLSDKLRDLKKLQSFDSVRAELDHIIQTVEDLRQIQRQVDVLPIGMRLAALHEYRTALVMRGIALVYGN
ncbi:MAG TPA: hypothetical protein VLG16_03975 [Candidatus Saccharimonadales bacterium]|nr:hypothetical protein [Candidatus Saccharimonadales bacterium]